MSEIAVNIQDLWKSYRIGQKKSTSFRESFGQLFSKSTAEERHFWALRELNLQIGKGEAIGIIGENGAGKSTLLKVLSKITYPTKGRVEISGRVSSLLEVGTGFHPELTGRQNVYLNGTILGMTRAEVTLKFDEIVAFSGVEKFIDTPVKRYSSGMKVRLAFSVAAHLEPEILIIDEVLAVGDAEFQKKCLGKMEDVTGDGRTVLFVSHNLEAVKNLCSRGIVLNSGKVTVDADPSIAIQKYLHKDSKNSDYYDLSASDIKRKGEGRVRFSRLTLITAQYKVGEKIEFHCEVDSNETFQNRLIDFGFAINNSFGENLIHGSNRFINRAIQYSGGFKRLKVRIDNILRPGQYYITLFLRIDGVIDDWIENAGNFRIEYGNPYGFSNSAEIGGLVMPKFEVFD